MVPGFDIPDTRAIRETEKALYVYSPEIGFWWVPKSQITVDSEVNEPGDHGELCITEWLAKQKGW